MAGSRGRRERVGPDRGLDEGEGVGRECGLNGWQGGLWVGGSELAWRREGVGGRRGWARLLVERLAMDLEDSMSSTASIFSTGRVDFGMGLGESTSSHVGPRCDPVGSERLEIMREDVGKRVDGNARSYMGKHSPLNREMATLRIVDMRRCIRF